MILRYTKNEILNNKNNFDFVFNTLKNDNNNNFVLLANNRDIITNKDYFLASKINNNVIDNKYLFYQHFGSSSIKKTKTDFKWLLTTIFKDSEYMQLLDIDTYYNKIDNYYKGVKNYE